MQQEPAFAREALGAGALGYVLKEAADDELVEAVRRAAAGESYLNPRLGARIASEPPPGPPDDLSQREVDVLRLIALGHTNAEIAEQLYLSVRTVETHRSHIQQKLQALDPRRARRLRTRARAHQRRQRSGLSAHEPVASRLSSRASRDTPAGREELNPLLGSVAAEPPVRRSLLGRRRASRGFHTAPRPRKRRSRAARRACQSLRSDVPQTATVEVVGDLDRDFGAVLCPAARRGACPTIAPASSCATRP